jgi:hypothetical protein
LRIIKVKVKANKEKLRADRLKLNADLNRVEDIRK